MNLPAADLHSFHVSLWKVDPAAVNHFCSSPLWTRQTLGGRARMIAESEYVTLTGAYSSNEARRNLTDFQETAQWQGGVDVPRCIFLRLMNGALDDSAMMQVEVMILISFERHTERV